ncbi:hypothetical protein [Rhizobium phaseoli]|uniref:hypothetical protein n=1 Tax=Rhizobium phaseoli TaxID=396 RepID=UPI001143CFD6|nr:hypothetical protein [Rhizobium phaseoli]
MDRWIWKSSALALTPKFPGSIRAGLTPKWWIPTVVPSLEYTGPPELPVSVVQLCENSVFGSPSSGPVQVETLSFSTEQPRVIDCVSACKFDPLAGVIGVQKLDADKG